MSARRGPAARALSVAAAVPSVAAAALAGACLAACQPAPRDAARAVEQPPAQRVAAAHGMSPEAQVVYERTLVRDPEPGCADLAAGVARPVDAMLEVVARASAPPWSGIRAATCLIRHHAPEVEAHMIAWVSRRATMGLGFLVLDHLDRLDAAVARRVAHAALRGEYPDAARVRIARSTAHGDLLDGVRSEDPPAPTFR